MTRGTIQKMFLEAATGTAGQVFGDTTQRIAQSGGTATQEHNVHKWFGVGIGDHVGESRARPRSLFSSHSTRFLPAAADRRGYGRRRQSAGR
jgi:hypothetical protein